MMQRFWPDVAGIGGGVGKKIGLVSPFSFPKFLWKFLGSYDPQKTNITPGSVLTWGRR
jgi:hypothetical protein